MSGIGAFARARDGSLIGRSAAESEWIPIAREFLATVASRPYAVTTQRELAQHVLSRSGIEVNPSLNKWIGPFLTHLTQACVAEGEPPLGALVTADHGKVGPAFDEALASLELGAETPKDRERLAAELRLQCYRWADAPEPAGGWRLQSPAAGERSPRARAPRATAHRAPAPEPVAVYCPSCFVQLPATGVCDNCA